MQQDAASRAGFIAGEVFVLVLPLIFILLSAGALRRPRANAKCVWSLILVLCGLMLTMVVNWTTAQWVSHGIASGVVAFIFLLSMIASAILAIAGLAGYRRRRSRHGRSHAIVALCLNGLFLAAVIVGFVTARNRSASFAAQTQTLREPFVSVPLNFRFTIPAPWVSFPGSALYPASALSLVRANPQIYLIVVAEKMGVESRLDNQGLASLVKAQLESAAGSFKILSETPVQLREMNGVRLDFDADAGGMSLSYVDWLVVRNGFAYRLVA